MKALQEAGRGGKMRLLSSTALAAAILGAVVFFKTDRAFGAPGGRGIQSEVMSDASSAEKSSKAGSSQAAAKRRDSALGDALAGSKEQEAPPVYIRSTTVNLDSKQRVFVYRENVEITRGDLIITADVVTGKYSEANELETVLCEQNVVVTKGETLKATSNRAVYDVKKDIIVLTENPELNDRGNILLADKVTIYVADDRSEAEGQVRVKVNKTEGAGFLAADDNEAGSSASKGAATAQKNIGKPAK
jgi:lipopolysaccharide transport protein LptA